MARRFALGLTCIATLGTILAACSADPGEGAGNDSEQGLATMQPRGGAHIMPLQKGFKNEAAPAGAKLVYNGGPVISNVKVWTVFWGSNVPDQANLNKFYTDITNSQYMDWLSEYNTPSQTIGRGSLGGSFIDTAPPSGTTITDAQIQQEIAKLIDAGKLPANDANNLYMVHFPAGITITMQGSSSCVQFCAYHGTFTHNGKNAYYGVMPDLSGGCAGGCGSAPTKLQNTTSVASHELIEAVTDCAVGLATQVGPPLAWYDNTNGEIGDICNGEQGTVGAWTVQKQFSNKKNACVVIGDINPTDGGTDSGGNDGGNTDGGGTDSGGNDGGGSCSHDECSTGGKLASGCDSCVTKICAQDSYCCNTQWDNICVNEVKSICNKTCGGGSTCAHSICTAGTKLTSTCDPCATKICAADSYCCNNEWDRVCVGEVKSICGQTCN